MECLSVLEPQEAGVERISPPVAAEVAGDLEDRGGSGSGSHLARSYCRSLKEPAKPPSSAESSSIGKNSDEEGDEEGENEVQSPLKGDFNASMDSLEEALPMTRGISSFYNGKSRSFASLPDASSCSSIKTIVKPESPYSRKRRNLLAYTLLSENNHHKATKTSHLIRAHGGGISKKPTFASSSSSSNRNTLALAVAMATTTTTTDNSKNSNLNDLTPGLKSRGLGPSPLSPYVMGVHNYHWRSFSFADLQQCGASTVGSNLGSPDHIS